MSVANKKVYLFGNWKMYLTHSESVAYARELQSWSASLPERAELAIFPSALSLVAVRQEVASGRLQVGAQNIYWVDKGGYTGEVSAHMYKEAGAEYALIGHSERRHLCGETNHQVRQKVEAALAAGLIPVLCVGETQAERDAAQTTEVVETQLRSALEDMAWPAATPLIVAYEPVWAIGTGQACDPDQAAATHALLQTFVIGLLPGTDPVFLYGGSVREDNVADYVAREHIHGVLVGGASVKLNSWRAIAERALAATE